MRYRHMTTPTQMPSHTHHEDWRPCQGGHVYRLHALVFVVPGKAKVGQLDLERKEVRQTVAQYPNPLLLLYMVLATPTTHTALLSGYFTADTL